MADLSWKSLARGEPPTGGIQLLAHGNNVTADLVCCETVRRLLSPDGAPLPPSDTAQLQRWKRLLVRTFLAYKRIACTLRDKKGTVFTSEGVARIMASDPNYPFLGDPEATGWQDAVFDDDVTSNQPHKELRQLLARLHKTAQNPKTPDIWQVLGEVTSERVSSWLKAGTFKYKSIH